MRAVAKTGGGLQKAVSDRGGISKIRCLAARARSDIEMEIHLSDDGRKKVEWKYALGLTQTGGGVFQTRAKLKYEKVWDRQGKLILDRPDEKDREDEKLLEYTFLEQPTSNSNFREIADFLQEILKYFDFP